MTKEVWQQRKLVVRHADFDRLWQVVGQIASYHNFCG